MKKAENLYKKEDEQEYMKGKKGFFEALLNRYSLVILIIVLLIALPISKILVFFISYDVDHFNAGVFEKRVSLLSYYSNYPKTINKNYLGNINTTLIIEEQGKIVKEFDDIKIYNTKSDQFILFMFRYEAISIKSKDIYAIIKIPEANLEKREKIARFK